MSINIKIFFIIVLDNTIKLMLYKNKLTKTNIMLIYNRSK